MPKITIENLEGEPYDYTVQQNCTGTDLYNIVLGLSGGPALKGCDGLAPTAIRLLFQGREISNNSNVVSGLQENSRVTVVYNERGGNGTLGDLMRNINFTICSCKSRSMNSTMYAKQQCQNPRCQRWRCFFCNRDWNDSTMRNHRYTCTLPECKYQLLLNFQMVPMGGTHSRISIPNMRFCPKCGHHGGYGGACKYHTCSKCNFEFCYFCLKSQEQCQNAYGSGKWYEPCVNAPVRQSFTDLPTIR